MPGSLVPADWKAQGWVIFCAAFTVDQGAGHGQPEKSLPPCGLKSHSSDRLVLGANEPLALLLSACPDSFLNFTAHQIQEK